MDCVRREQSMKDESLIENMWKEAWAVEVQRPSDFVINQSNKS